VPETIIGADVIVGFPGETDADFAQTRRLAESGLIDYLHVFSYSDRPGTIASGMADKVPAEIIKERNAILTELSSHLRAAAHRRQLGRELDVIAEHRKDGALHYFAVADNYIKVRLPNQTYAGKQTIRVRVNEAFDDCVAGDLIDSATRVAQCV